MKSSEAQSLKHQLRKSYGSIATEFASSRQYSWPGFSLIKEEINLNGPLLDLGCGNGRLYGFLKELGNIDYTGVDFCPELLEKARHAFPGVEFVEQDMSKLDLENEYSSIVSVAAFHHLPGKQQRKTTLKAISRHLKDDGVLVGSVWNLWQRKYLKQHLRSWLKCIFSGFRHDPRDLEIPFGKEKVPRYYHAFLPGELRKLLKKNGFEVLRFESIGHNYWFVAHKNVAETVSHPLFAKPQRETPLRTPRPVATSNR